MKVTKSTVFVHGKVYRLTFPNGDVLQVRADHDMWGNVDLVNDYLGFLIWVDPEGENLRGVIAREVTN